MGEEYEPDERIMRDPLTGKNRYVGNISYEDWRKMVASDMASLVGGRSVLSTTGYLMTDFGVKMDMGKLKAVDPRVISDVSKQYKILLNKYPQVREWAKQSKVGGLVISAGTFEKRTTMAATKRGNPIITLATSYFRDKDRLVAITANDIRSGHSMPAKDITNYTYNHEFGHVVENYLLRDDNKDHRARKIANDIIGSAKSMFGLSNADIASMLSRYSTDNERKLFAEIFANLHGGKPNKLAKAMEKYLEDKL